jgi:hypothetical protein
MRSVNIDRDANIETLSPLNNELLDKATIGTHDTPTCTVLNVAKSR